MKNLIVITGPMFSGKSEELIRLINRACYARKKILVIKPELDTRQSAIRSRRINDSGEAKTSNEHPALSIPNDPIRFANTIAQHQPDELFIDETQFFDNWIINEVKKILLNPTLNTKVYVAGLDQTAWGKTFGPMGELMALANEIRKFTAVCFKCGRDASMTFKKVHASSSVIDPGDSETYEARCFDCWHEPN